MKHLLLSLSLVACLFATTNCDKELDKLDKDIAKTKSAKKLNEAKLEYLNGLKAKIEANCVNGQIDKLKLKELKTTEQQNYELTKLNKDKAKLKEKEDKLKAKEEKLKAKHEKDLQKIEDKKAKAKAKEEKQKLKEEKKKAKEIK